MKIEITHRYTGSVLFSFETDSIKVALEAAVKSGANLDGANLVRANLDGANLDGANLDGANLYGANLYGANLDGANLYGANLYGANLDERTLNRFRDDVWAVLSAAPAEVPGLIAALKAGTVEGSSYEGDCACLVGTIAKVRGCGYKALGTLKPDSSRMAEQWFLGIHKGDTPETSKAAKLAHDWATQWLGNMTLAFAK